MDKNSFLKSLLENLIYDYQETLEDIDSFFTFDREKKTPIIFLGETAFYLARNEYSNDSSEIAYGRDFPKYVEMTMTKWYYKCFINHLSIYGKIIIENMHSSDGFAVSTIKLYPTIFDEDVERFSSFLHDYVSTMLGEISITFRIYHISSQSDTIPRSFVRETITAEYINPIKKFCFSVSVCIPSPSDSECKNAYRTLCDIISNITVKSGENLQTIDYDSKKARDPEDIVNMVCNDKTDMKLFHQLKYRLTTIDKEEQCTICMELTSTGFKTSCNHIFHIDCIKPMLEKYYKELAYSWKNDRELVIEYDITGNVIRGAPYNYSCPNCKTECFKLLADVDMTNGQKMVKNPENCIYII
jgi:hypothetical protein